MRFASRFLDSIVHFTFTILVLVVMTEVVSAQTRTLTVTSCPSSKFFSVLPADNNGSTGGAAPKYLSYNNNASVRVELSHTFGFAGWWLDGVRQPGYDSWINVTMNANHQLEMRYEEPGCEVCLDVRSVPITGVPITITYNGQSSSAYSNFLRCYQIGSGQIQLEAPQIAPDGRGFISWLKNGQFLTDQTIIQRFTPYDNATYTANYGQPPSHTLTINSEPISGVNVSVSPSDNLGRGDVLTNDTRVFYRGTQVTLGAHCCPGNYTFLNWKRDGVFYSAANPIVVTVDGNHTYTAAYGTITETCLLTLSSPIGGETWVPGSTHDICWELADCPTAGWYTVEYTSDDNSTPILIRDNIPISTTCVTWRIPDNAQKTSTYRVIVHVRKTDTEMRRVQSNYFTVQSCGVSAPVLEPVQVGCNSITLHWSAVVDADGYRIMRSTQADPYAIVDKNDLSFVDNNVSAPFIYRYKVVAYKAFCSDGVSNEQTGQMKEVPDPPTAPTITYNRDGVDICWNAVEGATQYDVFRSDNPNTPLGHTPTTCYPDSYAPWPNCYRYQVRAQTSCGPTDLSSLSDCAAQGEPPQIKILSVMQRASGTSPSTPLGLQYFLQVTDPDGAGIWMVKLYIDNMNDIPDDPRSIELSQLPSFDGYYYYDFFDTSPFGLTALQNGNRIQWRIEAIDENGGLTYYPGPTAQEKEETRVLDYNSIHGSLRVLDWGKGLVGIRTQSLDDSAPDTVIITNATSIDYAVKMNRDYDTKSGATIPLLTDQDFLPARTIPFGLLNPPKILVMDREEQRFDEVTIRLDGYDGYAVSLTVFRLLGQAVGICDNENDLLEAVRFIYLLKAFDNIATGDMETKVKSGLGILASLLQDPDFVEGLLKRIRPHLDPLQRLEQASTIRAAVKQLVQPIKWAKFIADAAGTIVDHALHYPAVDDLALDMKNRITLEVGSVLLPGAEGTQPVMSSPNEIRKFIVRVKNISQQKLYNVWLGFDIIDPEGNKVEHTKTPVVDPVTQVIGRIDFGDKQGIDLDPGEIVEYESVEYVFSSSVTGHSYYASDRYQYRYKVWSGYPGATAPLASIGLSDVISEMFSVRDATAPEAPSIKGVVSTFDPSDPSVGERIVLTCNRNTDDKDVVAYRLYQTKLVGGAEFHLLPREIATGAEEKGRSFAINRSNGADRDYFEVSAVDLGGNESPKSSRYVLDNGIYDVSEAHFSETPPTVGNTLRLLWSSGPLAGPLVSIDVWNGSRWVSVASQVANEVIDNVYAWKIPNGNENAAADFAGNDRKIRVTSSVDSRITAFSDVPFSIEGVVVTTPQGFETWRVGTQHEIRWNKYGSVSRVRIDVSINGGGSWTELTGANGWDASTPFQWTIPQAFVLSENCKIRVRSFDNDQINDVSNFNFQTVATLPIISNVNIAPTIPTTGSSATIHWTSTADVGNSVKLDILQGTTWMTIQNSVANVLGQNSYTWQIPNGTSQAVANWAGYGRVVKVSAIQATASNVSQEFAIRGLALGVPNGGEEVTIGSQQLIAWSFAGELNGVKLDISTNNGDTWTPINNGIVVDPHGTYYWTVPEDVSPSTNCLIRIKDSDNDAVNDLSDGTFSIVRRSAPDMPSGLKLTAGCGQIRLDWNPVQGASSYCVYRDDEPPNCDIPNNGYIDNNAGLLSHTYRISAKNELGESPQSAPISGKSFGIPSNLTIDSYPLGPIGSGETISLRGNISPDNVNWSWSADCGDLIGSGDEVTWKAPEVNHREYCEIRAQIQNECGSIEDTLLMEVIPASTNCFISDFSGPTVSNPWRIIHGTWLSGTGELLANSNGDWATIQADTLLGDGSIDFNASILEGSATAEITCEFRIQPNGDRYSLLNFGWTNTETKLFKITSTGAVELAATRFESGQIGHSYHITIIVVGNRIRCYRNGLLIYDVEDPKVLPRGNFSLHTYDAIVKFENFSACGQIVNCALGKIAGSAIYGLSGLLIPSVEMILNEDESHPQFTSASGEYSFNCLAPNPYYVCAYKPHVAECSAEPGVSVADIILIRRHLAHLNRFESGLKYLAADVNCDGLVSVADIIKIRRCLARIEPFQCSSWKFVGADYDLDTLNWFGADRCRNVTVADERVDGIDFLGVRLGDVNGDWHPVGIAPDQGERPGIKSTASEADIEISAGRVIGKIGDTIDLPIILSGTGTVAGLEIHANFSPDLLTCVGITSSILGGATFNCSSGEAHIVWDDLNAPIDVSVPKEVAIVRIAISDRFVDSASFCVERAELVDPEGNVLPISVGCGYVVLDTYTTVDEGSGELPTMYSLDQCYPNPLNPTTEIRFGLPAATQVLLEVYNLAGQRVSTLVNGHMSAGNHSVRWDASQFASGIYFYRMVAGEFVETRKMLLLK